MAPGHILLIIRAFGSALKETLVILNLTKKGPRPTQQYNISVLEAFLQAREACLL